MLRAAAIVLLAGCVLSAGEAPLQPAVPPPTGVPAVPPALPAAPTPKAPATAAPAPPAERIPLPATEAIAAAAKELRVILKEDFAARDAAARALLAQKLLDLGGKGSPAGRCAALREAEELAGRLGDLPIAEQAATALSAAFAIDPADERLRALSGCSASIATADALSALIEAFLDISATAGDADDYATAERAAQQADLAARRLRDPGLSARTRSQLAHVRALAEEWRKVGSTSDLLGQPDPAGCGRRGRFLCLTKGEWTRGLPELAGGDDPAMAAAARAELAANAPDMQAAAGLAWADLAAKQPREAREEALRHAAGLLRLALPGMDVPDRARCEKRLAEIERQLGPNARRISLPAGAALYFSCDRDTLIQSGGKLLLRDLSGNGCNGIVNGARPVAGAWGGALEFSGEQSVDCGNPSGLRIAGSLTVTMWLRPTTVGDARRNPFNKSYGGEGTLTIEPGGQMTFFCGVNGRDADGNYEGLGSDFPLAAGAWTHVAVVRDSAAKTVTWYRNGKRANSSPTLYPVTRASEQPLILGRGYAGGYLGLIDEVGVWARALRDQEIAALHAATAPGR